MYPTQNFLPDDYAREVWYALLKDIPYPDANMAVMEILKTSPYPPTVADITGRVYRRIAGNEMTETEAWSRVRVAIRNSGYNAETEFAKLPEAEKVKGIDSVGRKEHHTPEDIARIEQRVESMWKERDERESGKAV